jgi:acetylornithine deacetylase/succinyl-diaminopimelate desuccinylase-like protein
LKGLKTELLQPEDLTPLLLAEIEGEIKDKTVLFYGHFDKQPHGSGWDENKGPTTPII